MLARRMSHISNGCNEILEGGSEQRGPQGVGGDDTTVYNCVTRTLQSDGFPRVGRAPTFLNLKEGNSKNINLYYGNLEGVSE